MRKRKLIVISSVSVLSIGVIVAAVLAFSRLNSPATAKLLAGAGTNDQGTYQIDLSPKLKVGKYLSFDYPAGLNAYPGQVSGPELEIFNFTAQDAETWFLGVEVSTLKFGSLASSSDYTYRKNNPTIYSESHETINNQLIDVMTNKTVGGFSEVAFILHGGELATVSLLGDDSRGVKPLQITFNMVLSSLHWNQV